MVSPFRFNTKNGKIEKVKLKKNYAASGGWGEASVSE